MTWHLHFKKTIMKNALNSVQVSAPSVNAFDLSHDVKLSLQMGKLVPVLAMECLPGDRVRIGCENLIRLAPMLAPMMHRVDVRIEYFFVPNRLVWENWETFITNGGSDPATQGDPLPAPPFINYTEGGGGANYSDFPLLDYMGLPDPVQCPLPDGFEKISAIPFAAYQKIYNDYYRDENLIDEDLDAFNLRSGDNNAFVANILAMRKRAWEADYFTKALPFAQKGEPVTVPLGTLPDVPVYRNSDTVTDTTLLTGTPDDLTVDYELTTHNTSNDPIEAAKLYAKTSAVDDLGVATINDLRLAYRLQEWLEKNARGGTRYSELIRVHFNVMPEDARLQRPEYIVGVKNPIRISEVLNTTGTDEAPQGNMAGHGVSYAEGNWGKYHCTEHGYIIGIMSVMPKTAYQQGIPRHFSRLTDPTEYAWPTFANLGEQDVATREIMAFQNDPVEPFGYMPRYMEYKNLPSRVCGEFKTTLDFWHMGRIFDPATPPVLNQAFIEADPTQRVFAVTDPTVDQLYCQVMHHIMVVRALPVYGTPTF
ncbi:MAG: major capsid protein [Microviridae sp.]|nr:MAG: major capsid protein [Microviridae sp.]